MRKKLIAGNWKMNLSLGRALQLAKDVVELTRGEDPAHVEVVVIPPSCFLGPIAGVVADTHVGLGAQNFHGERSGAYTGEIAGPMLVDLGVRWVLCGHSERRQLFGETPEFVGTKVTAAHRDALVPILCVGETLEEREADVTETIVAEQLEAGLAGLLHDQMAQTVIAYEPVWAIGTGRNASPEQAQAVHAFIRGWLGARIGGDLADETRIIYGGSVKAQNAEDLLGQPDIDGALVGGASLDAPGFAKIVAGHRAGRVR
ncbi:MAG: triose-phosphate isomerase [Myxococcota bacterium]